MADATISFGQAGFESANLPSNVKVVEQDDVFLLKTEDNSPVQGVGIGTVDDEPVSLLIGVTPDEGESLKSIIESEINFSGDSNRAEILGSARNVEVGLGGGSNNAFVTRGQVREGTISSQAGNGRVRITGESTPRNNVARDLEVNLGTGDDLLVFGGNIRKVQISDAGGNNIFRFKGDVRDSSLDLTEDTGFNKIRLSENAEFTGFRIRGADDEDVLFIGSTEYQFEGDRTWFNVEDSSDTIRF